MSVYTILPAVYTLYLSRRRKPDVKTITWKEDDDTKCKHIGHDTNYKYNAAAIASPPCCVDGMYIYMYI